MKILAFGKALPDKIVSNYDISKIVDTSNEWIVQRTGIEERRISNKNTADLAHLAVENMLKNSSIDKNSIDLIICATSTPDNYVPSVACLLQEKLCITSKVMAFDVNAACTGFIYALKIAAAMLKTYHKRALVVGADIMSKIIDYKDRNTCILFGDGAAALLLERDENFTHFYTGSRGEECNLYAKSLKLNSNLDNTELNSEFLRMNGGEVFKFAISAIEESITNILLKNDLTLSDIKLIIPHQANKRIIDFVAKKMKVDINKFYINLDKYGNTSAASIPIALSEALEKKYVTNGDKVLLVGFGAGLTWGATILEI